MISLDLREWQKNGVCGQRGVENASIHVSGQHRKQYLPRSRLIAELNLLQLSLYVVKRDNFSNSFRIYVVRSFNCFFYNKF